MNIVKRMSLVEGYRPFSGKKFLFFACVMAGLASLTACLGESATVGSSSGNQSSSSSSGQGNHSDMTGGEAYKNANGIRGGQLYSRFWAEATDFSLNNSSLHSQSQLDAIDAKADFFRCQHCHGWDRLGRDGGFSNREPLKSRPRVADVDLASISEVASPQSLFNSIKNVGDTRSVDHDLNTYDPDDNATMGDKMPNYSDILTDAQIWDIVKFLKEEALDTTALYDLQLLDGQYPTRARDFLNLGVDGSAVAGEVLFSNKCANCHGSDGTEFLVDGGAYTVGRQVRSKPHVAQHKVKFGHLGSIMGPILMEESLSEIQDLFAALRNIDKYPDTKPDPEPEAIDGELQFLIHCSGCHSGGGEGGNNARHGDVTGASASLINAKIQSVPRMHHLKPDNPVQAVSQEEIAAIVEFLKG